MTKDNNKENEAPKCPNCNYDMTYSQKKTYVCTACFTILEDKQHQPEGGALVNKYGPRDGPPVVVGYSVDQGYFESLKTPEDRVKEAVAKRLKNMGLGQITDIKLLKDGSGE